MNAIWKGSISFGLVNIPISLFTATRSGELNFRLLRNSDLSPVNYKRIAERDGEEVPWDQIVKGYEYEKGKFVVLKEEDFQRVDIEATQTVNILEFVPLKEINPVLFHKPYYMEPQKGGDRAYTLLRDALDGTDKIGVAKVVIKTRQHLAAVKPHGESLMLELMYFPEELRDVAEFRHPRTTSIGKKELEMARTLIASMTTKWDPGRFKDDYREALEKMIKDKIARGGRTAPRLPARKRASNVIDLVEVLQQSLQAGRKKPAKGAGKTAKKIPASKKQA